MFASRLYLVSALGVFITAVCANPMPAPSANPMLPQRNATTGQNVNSTSPTPPNNNRNATIGNSTITGTNGGQAACDRGVTQFCATTTASPTPTPTVYPAYCEVFFFFPECAGYPGPFF
ncbi:hypothetical protein BC835DRAFT_1410730 [Cytidiella melzeri]|nr:hypothetical protein BC835DRAFT_1410730 [Cytidiella melzeri]